MHYHHDQPPGPRRCHIPVLMPYLDTVNIVGPHTGLMVMISPFDFLTFRSFIKKYQNLDFATTVFVAKMRIRYSFGFGCVSVGR